MTTNKTDSSQQGWNLNLVREMRNTYFTAPVGAKVVTPQERADRQRDLEIRSGIPPVPIMNPQQQRDTTEFGVTAAAYGAPRPNLVQPQDQQMMQQYLADPGAFAREAAPEPKGIIDSGKDILGRLFDTTDEADNVVESIWDGALRGLGWFYDRINQAATYGISVLPGGIEPLTWEQANEISFGQATVRSAAIDAKKFGGRFWTNFVYGIGVPQFVQAGIREDALFTRDDFNILDENQRRLAFEEDALGKWASGTTDFVFAVFADPFILGGKALKVTRVKWVDRPIRTKTDFDRAVTETVEDVARLKTGEAPVSPRGQFIQFAMDDATTSTQLLQHQTVKANGNRDTFVKALLGAKALSDKNQRYDAAGLVMRAVDGDVAARNELSTVMPSLADEIGQATRALTDARMAYSPDSLRKTQKEFKTNFERRQESYITLQKQFDEGLEGITKQQVDEAFRIADRARIDYERAANYKTRSPIGDPITEQEISRLTQIRNELIERDTFYRAAYDEAILGSGVLRNKGFGRGALGRAAERSRQRKATVTASLLATPNPWKVDTLYGVGRTSRVVNIWRWTGFEKPSGIITLRGLSNTEQSREWNAVLNNVKQYRGADKFAVVDGREVLIGGARRKEELLTEYLQATGGGVTDQNALALVLNKMEQAILTDIGLANQMTPTEVQVLLAKHSTERQRLISQLSNDEQKFFIDVKPNATGEMIEEIVESPYLESLLKDSAIVMNFSEAEKLAARYAKQLASGKARHLDDPSILQMLQNGQDLGITASQWGGEQLFNFYNAFNNLWRPGVLLRFGYLQRNAAEGIFRASAFAFSLAPLGDAGKQVALGARNAAVKRATSRAIRKAKKGSLENGQYAIASSKRFTRWRATQEEAFDKRIAEMETILKRTQDQQAKVNKNTAAWATANDNIAFQQRMLDETRELAELVKTDDVAALAYYRKQGNAKRRVGDGTTVGPDGMVLMNAFGDVDLTPAVLTNLSADVTTKTRYSLADDVQRNFFRALDEEYFVRVAPDEGMAYWQGTATALEHFRSSQLGIRVLRAKNQDDLKKIAWDLYDGDLVEIAEFVTGSNAQWVRAGGGRRGFDSYKDAEDYVGLLVGRLQQVAPNPELRRLATLSSVDPKDVRRLLDTDDYRDSLRPVVGNYAKEVGNKKFRDMYRDSVNKMFEILGTIPEDALVRAPFYAKRFAEMRDVIVRRLLEQYGDQAFIPVKDINAAYQTAHRAALRDTKEFLYTIDRRTNLGHYGEYLFPFISAAQNSVTALGKLAWRDPSLPAIMVAIWNAPDKANLTDDKGRISIPLPTNMIPDVVKKNFGLENMRAIKFNKEQFNVIFPESGYAFLPRFGPIVGVPAGLMMRYNWFGQSLETPEWLSGAIGEEPAKEIWDNWRDYIFGEERGVSPEFLSWNTIAPPAATKLIQMFQGMDSAAYVATYNKQFQSEMAKLKAGYRDTIPTPEELTQLTNGIFTIRMLANVFAFTPPQYETVIDPLVDTKRLFDRAYPEDSDRMFNEKFGNIMLMASDTSASRNVAGVGATLDSVARSRRYEGLIRKIAPNVQDNLSVLGIILNGDPDAEYDPSALAWQQTTKIPGINRSYRELITPEQANIETSRQAGWVAYIQFMDQVEAVMENSGIKSLKAREAEPLRRARDEFIESARNNPLYRGWYDDYINFGSTRTINAVEVIREALSDEQFMKDNADNPVWQSAYQYLVAREEVIRSLEEIDGAGYKESERRELRAGVLLDWDLVREKLKQESPRWATLANRYLDGDDNPIQPGVQVSLYQSSEPLVGSPPRNSGLDSRGYIIIGDEDEEF
jgi:hypothetical protein